jgi:hypothetical protein
MTSVSVTNGNETLLKKLGREGNDRHPGIILRRD